MRKEYWVELKAGKGKSHEHGGVKKLYYYSKQRKFRHGRRHRGIYIKRAHSLLSFSLTFICNTPRNEPLPGSKPLMWTRLFSMLDKYFMSCLTFQKVIMKNLTKSITREEAQMDLLEDLERSFFRTLKPSCSLLMFLSNERSPLELFLPIDIFLIFSSHHYAQPPNTYHSIKKESDFVLCEFPAISQENLAPRSNSDT